jgi:S1/P1 Nuclease
LQLYWKGALSANSLGSAENNITNKNSKSVSSYAVNIGVSSNDALRAILLVGDIHQPMHAVTNAGRGGTCQRINVEPVEENLHYAWDDAVVTVLEKQLETDQPKATERKLEALYPAGGDLSSFPQEMTPYLRG